jgi:WhiB family redox-sensing transcriptional regulator
VSKLVEHVSQGEIAEIPGPDTPVAGRREPTSDRRAAGEFDLLDLAEDPDEEEWQDRALCQETDPEAFFPEKGGSTREAKRICGVCEVKRECLDYALQHQERFGIWGGLSERERRRMQRRAIPDAPVIRHEYGPRAPMRPRRSA